MSLGTVRYDPDACKWIIHCQPHVAMRFKRVFACVDRGHVGKFTLSDTPDIARDLQWFIERFPLTIENGLDHLVARSEQQRERASLVAALLARKGEIPKFNLAMALREYQTEAAALLLASGGVLLADDVGLGKTASAIGTFTDPRTLPALVVTLAHLPRQWQGEINKFAPSLLTHVVRKGQPYDLTIRRKRAQISFNDRLPDVIIINYHKLAGWAETLAPIVNSVVYDEVQELRRRGDNKKPSRKYFAAAHISSSVQFRMGLSATPFYNYGGEMYNVLSAISPDSLGTTQEFATEWCNGYFDEKARIANPKAFGAHLRETGLMLRRTRQDVGRELPPVQRISHHIESDAKAIDKLSLGCRELAGLILSQGEAYRGQKMQASEEFSNKLRQATGIAKAPYVAEFARLLIDNGEKVVLYGWHRDVYSIWLDLLKDLRPAMYTGSESVAGKQRAKDSFISGETPLLIMSLRSGAGLDGLQGHCRTVIFGELDWSPGVHEQCVGRIHRDGQPEPVAAYFLVADDGADPIMAEVLGLKRNQIEGVRDPELELIEQLQTDSGHVKRLAEAWLDRNKSKSEVAA